MELRLNRRYKGPKYTIGNLYIDDIYFCDTLEDIDRGITSSTSLEDISRKRYMDRLLFLLVHIKLI